MSVPMYFKDGSLQDVVNLYINEEARNINALLELHEKEKNKTVGKINIKIKERGGRHEGETEVKVELEENEELEEKEEMEKEITSAVEIIDLTEVGDAEKEIDIANRINTLASEMESPLLLTFEFFVYKDGTVFNNGCRHIGIPLKINFGTAEYSLIACIDYNSQHFRAFVIYNSENDFIVGSKKIARGLYLFDPLYENLAKRLYDVPSTSEELRQVLSYGEKGYYPHYVIYHRSS